MPAGMARNINHLQGQAKVRNLHGVAFGEWLANLRDAVRTRPEHGDRKFFQKGGYAADMVSMVMCQ